MWNILPLIHIRYKMFDDLIGGIIVKCLRVYDLSKLELFPLPNNRYWCLPQQLHIGRALLLPVCQILYLNSYISNRIIASVLFWAENVEHFLRFQNVQDYCFSVPFLIANVAYLGLFKISVGVKRQLEAFPSCFKTKKKSTFLHFVTTYKWLSIISRINDENNGAAHWCSCCDQSCNMAPYSSCVV